MAKILVVYDSSSGNTKALALAVDMDHLKHSRSVHTDKNEKNLNYYEKFIGFIIY